MKRTVLIPALLLVAFALTRWPGMMPLNFSVAYGLVFCAGAFPRRLPWWAILGTLMTTDLVLNVFYYDTVLFSDYQAVNYLAYAGIYLLGRRFSTHVSIPNHVVGGLLGAVIFYVITNTASWLANPDYAKTFADWLRALTTGTNGWPETWTFFRNTLLSGGLFAGLISAALQSVEAKEPEPEEETEPEGAGGTEAAPEEAK
ncbi:MAG: DUF6580 family putative transport protein [Limisphaerales bacterium]